VGSHSHTHPLLGRLPAPAIDDELRRSKTSLEEVTGSPVTTFSVPRGLYTRRVGELAAAAGYETVYTSEPWTRPRAVGGATVIGRFSVHRETPLPRVLAYARGERSVVAREAAWWYARKAVKTVAWPAYDRVRRTLLARR
jgi:peptidoglycan/xylan/chitin deacetylase (PgdA/CDA1 family)